MKEQFVLDASALLSIVLDERGRERVDRILDRSRIHAVNLAEVVGRLVRSGMPAERAVATLDELQLEVEEEFGARQAGFCGALLGSRRDLGLSLPDTISGAESGLACHHRGGPGYCERSHRRRAVASASQARASDGRGSTLPGCTLAFYFKKLEFPRVDFR